MDYEKRKDPLTGEIFIPKRFNQKFATRKNQRDFNNIKARKKRHQKISTDRILDRNREILRSILKNRRTAVKSRDFLLGAGFDLKHFSGIVKVRGKEFYIIYEYSIHLDEDGNFLIEKE